MDLTNEKGDANVIQAAGGLVWRDSPRGKELAVIHRKRYGDWTLPKGKLIPGEHWQDAALREVKEETGCNAQLKSFAGSVSYTVNDVPKVVLFWNMTLADGCNFQPSEEVDQLLWLPVPKALAKLDHPGERTLLMDSHQVLVSRPSFGSRIRRGWRSTSHRRLAGSLAAYSVELDHLIKKLEQKGNANSLLWADAARTLLDKAQSALENNDVELGWRCFNAAQRMELFGLADLEDKSALRSKAQAILREAVEKLGSWRKEAIKELLNEDDKLKQDVTLNEVFYASLILQEHFDNVYHKLWAIRRQLAILALVALLAVTIWVVLVLPQISDNVQIKDPNLAGSVVLFGVMGASISGILSLARSATGTRIPDQLLNSWITLARLVVGAVAALAVYSFMISGLLKVGEMKVTSGLICAISFAAGFSERLMMRAIETVTK